MSKINIGEVLAEGLKAKGIAIDSDAAKKFLATNADLGKMEVEAEKIGELVLLSFDDAKRNTGLKQHFEDLSYGSFASNTENAWTAMAQKYGVAGDIIKNRDLKPWERTVKAAEAIIAKLAEDNKGGKNDEKLEALRTELAELRKTAETEKGQIKAELETQLSQAKSQVQRMSVMRELSSGNYGKISPTIIGDFGDSIADKILGDSKYEIVHINNAWSIIDRKTKEVATNLQTGKELTLADVVKPYIKEEWLEKEDGSGGAGSGGHNNRKPEPKTITPEQQAKLEANRRMNGLAV